MSVTCECSNWARTGQRFITRHAPTCAHYDPESDAREIIDGLIRGMDAWASDEDGIHPEAWDAYRVARAATGNPVTNEGGAA